MEQLVATMLSPSYKYICSLVGMAGLLCLAYSPKTHPYLARPFVIDGAIEACRIQRNYQLTEEERRLDCLLLK